jgi:DNA-binding transcriptional regulator YdaS (Cro superfamily)
MTAPEFRALLRSVGLTQRALAQRLGVAPSTVNYWCMGRCPVPRYAVAYLEMVVLVQSLVQSQVQSLAG